MAAPIRIAVLCNHWAALPAIGVLLQSDQLAGVATPRIEHDGNRRAQMIAAQRQLPYAAVDGARLAEQLPEWIAAARADAVFVIGCPYKIPPAVLGVPRLGFFNFHFGILPKYRGPDPVFWQIKNREADGGLTVHRMDAELDHGPIVDVRRVAIAADDTYGLHVNKLAGVVAETARDTAMRLRDEGAALALCPQDAAGAAYQPRPGLADLTIDWSQPPAAISALVRAANPVYGGAVAFVRGVPVRVLQTTIVAAASASEAEPGAILAVAGGGALLVQGVDASLLRLDVLATDEGVLTGDRFARIYRMQAGERFESHPR